MTGNLLGLGLPETLVAGEPVTMTCTAPGRCSGTPPQISWTGPFSDTARDVSVSLANGTRAHSSELRFTPARGDDGKNLTCTVTYSPAPGPSTSRAVSLQVGSPRGGRTRAFIEISCKFVFMATGFLLAYYLTLLYYRRTPCCCPGSRRKDRPETLAAAARLPASPTLDWEVD
ncbi:myeloid cell surface antigen CD33-like [Emydura macquarii macquarii]|uniref:myeloid cell surface antigen CD33-like n=1 Tax=Emydura macquarii macquarii TaxID=1129001 RepID=UPI00352B0EBF